MGGRVKNFVVCMGEEKTSFANSFITCEKLSTLKINSKFKEKKLPRITYSNKKAPKIPLKLF
jgi:hypothetical protein